MIHTAEHDESQCHTEASHATSLSFNAAHSYVSSVIHDHINITRQSRFSSAVTDYYRLDVAMRLH